MTLPRQLSVTKISPYYDEEAIKRVDKVFVDGVHLPNCCYYDQDLGKARAKVDGLWQPMAKGVITLTEKS